MESFANNLIKRPLKLLALAMVLYLASQSFIVGLFVAVVGFFYLKEKAIQWSKVVPAAPKVSMPDASAKPQATAEQPVRPPEKQYERSAVVTPIRRTGTHDRS
ncbi:hypothetical protein ACUXQ2_006392 [Cupriavidus metallidurans]|uniref:hypothetical protein n=1 Tax=Cupriavidus sp. HMR-1 TaxID=1249621 RepID=UPI0002A3D073|nr:hypothetical protein [Cupriavidus sp. HMR-1]ELA00350.1 hypothetical protein D769_05684 [Cupriavidus sp. HMR-1]